MAPVSNTFVFGTIHFASGISICFFVSSHTLRFKFVYTANRLLSERDIISHSLEKAFK